MKLSQLLRPNKWEVRRTIWPYQDGWGVYNPYRRTIMDSGIPTKERAQEICDEMNAQEKRAK